MHDVLEATGAQFVCPEADTWLLSRDNMGQFRSLARSYVQDTPDILAGEGTAVTFGGLTATYMSTPGHTHISFEDGLNVVYGKNEAGKSTLHTFIKGIVYAG